MTPAELIERRKAFGYNQTQMADVLGLSLRGYQKIEAGDGEVRRVYELAIAQIGLELAIEQNNPMLAPQSARKMALDFARMVAG